MVAEQSAQATLPGLPNAGAPQSTTPPGFENLNQQVTSAFVAPSASVAPSAFAAPSDERDVPSNFGPVPDRRRIRAKRANEDNSQGNTGNQPANPTIP